MTKREHQGSAFLGILAGFVSAILGTGTAFLIIHDIFFTVADDSVRSIDSLLIGNVFFATIGFSLSYGCYRLAQKHFDPEQFSTAGKMDRILIETESLDTSDVDSSNFYSDAEDWELASLYKNRVVQANPEKLHALVFEIRRRFGNQPST